jgi:hypothetical protein
LISVKTSLTRAALLYALSGAVTSGVAILLLGQPWSLAAWASSPATWLGLVVILLFAAMLGDLRHEAWVWRGAWIVFGGLALLQSVWPLVVTHAYGDNAYLVISIAEGREVARWLGGLTIAQWLYDPMQRMFADAYPEPRLFALVFARALSSLAIAGGTLALLWRWPGRDSLVVTALGPLWLLFGFGYVEYYPLVAPLLLFALAWSFDLPLEARSPVTVGLLAGALWPLGYLGFMPFALALLVAYGLATPRRAPVALACALAFGTVALWLLWPDGVGGYFMRILTGTAVGEDAIVWPPHRGQGVEGSPLFAMAHLLSAVHLRELFFMAYFAGGLLVLPLLAAVLAARVRRAPRDLASLRDGRLPLALLLCAAYLFYFFTMLPRLGPVRDIDLFFCSFMVTTFIAVELLPHEWSRWRTVNGRLIVMSVVAGHGVALLVGLAFEGLAPGVLGASG